MTERANREPTGNARLVLPPDLLDPNVRWYARVPQWGGVINVAEDDKVTRCLAGCLTKTSLPALRRAQVWHRVWEGLQHLPRWDMPFWADYSDDLYVGDWNSPTEFVNWFSWNVACAYLWTRRMSRTIVAPQDIEELLRSSTPYSDGLVTAVSPRNVRAARIHLAQVAIRFLDGPASWDGVPKEAVVYPYWGLAATVDVVYRYLPDKLQEWYGSTRWKGERRAVRRCTTLLRDVIPRHILYPAGVLEQIGGAGASNRDYWR